jgi:kumamolisin
MKRSSLSILIGTAVLLIAVAISTFAQTQSMPINYTGSIKPAVGQIFHPKSGVENPADIGVRAHTNFEVFVPAGGRPLEAPPYSGYGFETPASLGCLYGFVTAIAGCNPNATTANPTGGSKSIAIVDAFDDPWAGPDLAYFSAQFGLPFKPSQLVVVYADGYEPSVDFTGGWELEESLDIEWAHAMAPSAKIYLVEATDNSFTNLLTAVTVATNLVQCGQTTTCASITGAGEVSMSWGGSEFSTETTYDSGFAQTNVTFFGSSGDSPGTIWPCASPNVVCAGGTSTRRSVSTLAALGQSTWDLDGGGVSPYEAKPSYQSGVTGTGAKRSVPDLSFDANPVTGVWVWDSNCFVDLGYICEEGLGVGWFLVGGTSLSSPALAGIVNNAAGRSGGSFAANSAAELAKIYTNRAVTADYAHPAAGGFCGPYGGYVATTTLGNWDPCTGIGYPKGYAGK